MTVAPLLAWGERHRRPFPWRATRDPWAVLVSEVMAQQTRIDRVVDKYPAFVAAFPTVGACAAANVADVIRAWEGMGFNRRAVNLHRAAGVVVDEHGGDIPADLDALLALPGVGPYTARAVLAFAFEQPAAVVDTNVARVLARWAGHRLTAGAAQAAADAAVPPDHVWAWNQTLMEFGARVCTARSPDCGACPAVTHCAWHDAGRPDPDPAGSGHGQGRFAGSDREGRGRLVAAIRSSPVALDDVAACAGWPDDDARAARVASTLVGEGLAVVRDDHLALP